MQSTFTADDVGKVVETSAGDIVGTVGAIDPGTAYVEPDPEAGEAAIDTPARERPSDAVPVADDAVEQITEDSVVLDPSLSAEDLVSGATSPDDDRPASEPNAGEAEYAPDETVTNDGEASPPRTDAGSDPSTEIGGRIDGDQERRSDPAGNPADELDAMAEADTIDEEEVTTDMDAGETTDATEDRDEGNGERREPDVDPRELADPEAEVRPGEDVGQRTNADIESERVREDDTESGTEDGEGDRRTGDTAGSGDENGS